MKLFWILKIITSFQVVVHCKGFAVKDSVGVLSYPVANNQKAAGVGEHKIQLNMTMSEYEVINVGM